MEKVFDKNKKTFEERSKHIDELTKNGVITEHKFELNKTMFDDSYGKYMEQITNYLLESSDIPSGRKVEASYYQSEQYYRSHIAVGKNTICLDNNIVENYSDNSELNSHHIDEDFLKRLFCIQKLSEDDVRRFITKGCIYTQTDSKELRGAIIWLWDVIIDNCTDREKEIVKMFDGNSNTTGVAMKMGISDRYVRKVLQKISKNTVKWFRFAE